MSIRAGFVSAAALAILAGSASAQFRVLPYQQNPQQDGMTLNWFASVNQTSQITISGPGLAAPLTATLTPSLMSDLDYSTQEKAIAPRPADMFPDNSAWKYSYVATGLTPASQYAFTVTLLDGSSHSGTFTTAPLATTTQPIRMTVLSDSETLIAGRTTFREWARTTPQLPGSTGRPAGTGRGRDRYFLTETAGYQANLAAIDARDPDLIIMPGDLVEGSGNALETHRRWDEFWRHNAGQYDDVVSKRPLIAAIGNNCIFSGAIAPGTQQEQINKGVDRAIKQWDAYFDTPGSPFPQYGDLFFRQDYGPVTIITLCSVGAVGATDQISAGPSPVQVVPTGSSLPVITDTNRAWLNEYPFGNLPDPNIASVQYAWAQQQLADARAQGQIIFLQWHHTPWSRGIHGTNVTSNQSGEAMRIYVPLAEQFGVAGIFTGHSEVFERSFIDSDNDGRGVNLWDVGAAGDGLRGVEDAGPGLTSGNIVNWRNNPSNPDGQSWNPNPFSVWAADQSEPEFWSGNRLTQGGKHYGFLEVDVQALGSGQFRVSFQPFHIFPLNAGDASFTVTGTELRRYNDRVVLEGPANDLRPARCADVDFNNDGVFPDALDLEDFLLVLSGGTPSTTAVDSVDFNEDGVFPDDADVASFLRVLGGGQGC